MTKPNITLASAVFLGLSAPMLWAQPGEQPQKVVVWEVHGDHSRQVTYIRVDGIWQEQNRGRAQTPAPAEAPEPADIAAEPQPATSEAPVTTEKTAPEPEDLPKSIDYRVREPWQYGGTKDSLRYRPKTDWTYRPRKNWTYTPKKNWTYSPKRNWTYIPKSDRFATRRYIPRSR